MTKFGMVTRMGKGVFLRGSAIPLSSQIRLDILHARAQYEKQPLNFAVIKLDEKKTFTGSRPRPLPWPKFLVTQMLTCELCLRWLTFSLYTLQLSHVHLPFLCFDLHIKTLKNILLNFPLYQIIHVFVVRNRPIFLSLNYIVSEAIKH